MFISDRDVRNILAQNENVYALKLVNYKGEIIYMIPETDKTAKYAGASRMVEDMNRLYQVQAVNPSVRLLTAESFT